MKQIAHTINREGKRVPGNGFKQPTPTTTCHNHGIWMHSIDRKGSGNPIAGFIILGVVIAIGVLILKIVE